MSAITPISDAELLKRYEKGNNQTAFRALVERYQGMVLGAAFRRTRNLELAREVTQEVFAALARKARFLSARASIGGWLHQAAIYQAARTVQSEARRHARQERFAKDAPIASAPVVGGGAGADHLTVVDEAMDFLSGGDREVIVLHYFQDLSYPEMAKVLGINEAAVRQRVSRALDRLGKRLREQGISGNVVVLLLGAVAVQSSIAAPAGLAGAALATAAAGGGASAYLLLAALLSKGVIKTAAVLLAVAGTAAVWNEVPIQELHAPATVQLSAEQEFVRIAAPVPPESVWAGLTASDSSVARQPLMTVSRGAVQEHLSAVAASRVSQPNGRSAAAGQDSRIVAPAGSPVLATNAGITVTPAVPNKKAPAAAKARSQTETGTRSDAAIPIDPLPSIPDYRFPGLLGELAELGGLPAVIDELRRVERIPHEAAKLYGELLEDVLLLEPVKRTLVEGFLEDHYNQLNEQGIAGIRPPEVARETWQTLREVKVSEAVDGVQEILSDVAPDPEVIDDVFALVEKSDEEEGGMQPLASIPAEAGDKIVPVLEKIPVPGKFPLLP